MQGNIAKRKHKQETSSPEESPISNQLVSESSVAEKSNNDSSLDEISERIERYIQFHRNQDDNTRNLTAHIKQRGDSYQHKIATLQTNSEEELESIRRQIEQQAANKDQIFAEISQLKAQLTQERKGYDELKRSKQELRQERKQLEGNLNECTKKLSSFERALKSKKSDFEDVSRKTADFEKKLVETDDKCKELVLELERGEGELEALEGKLGKVVNNNKNKMETAENDKNKVMSDFRAKEERFRRKLEKMYAPKVKEALVEAESELANAQTAFEQEKIKTERKLESATDEINRRLESIKSDHKNALSVLRKRQLLVEKELVEMQELRESLERFKENEDENGVINKARSLKHVLNELSHANKNRCDYLLKEKRRLDKLVSSLRNARKLIEAENDYLEDSTVTMEQNTQNN